jgi:hypothetical protein
MIAEEKKYGGKSGMGACGRGHYLDSTNAYKADIVDCL